MEKNPFKDLLFQILNENDFFFEDIEADDKNDSFTIRCTDGSSFLLKVQDVIPQYFTNAEFVKLYPLAKELAADSNASLLDETQHLAQNNPYVFLILIAILKLSELQIISNEEAQHLISLVQPHTQELKEQWKQNKNDMI